MLFVGAAFFLPLFYIWHIPSISIQLGLYCYMGFSTGVQNLLYTPDDLNKTMANEAVKKMVLNSEGDFFY